jgi:hypothetical protein
LPRSRGRNAPPRWQPASLARRARSTTTLLGFLDDATRKVPVAEFFLTEDAHGYFHLLRRLLRRYGVPLSFCGDKHGVFVRNDDHWTVEKQLAGKRVIFDFR